jgi:hypothetical protein
MAWTICVVLFALWILGIAASYTMGGLIHILVLAALVVLVFQILQGRAIV